MWRYSCALQKSPQPPFVKGGRGGTSGICCQFAHKSISKRLISFLSFQKKKSCQGKRRRKSNQAVTRSPGQVFLWSGGLAGAQRCPVRALRIGDSPLAKNKRRKAAKLIHPDRCLGCGVCVYKCSTQSLFLEPRTEIQDPPKDAREWMVKLVMDQEQARATSVRGAKK